MLESMIKEKWEVVDGMRTEPIPDVKWDNTNDEILRMLSTFITTM